MHKEPSVAPRELFDAQTGRGYRALCRSLFFSTRDRFQDEERSPRQPGGGNMPEQLISGLRWLECGRDLSVSYQSSFGEEFQDHSQ